MQGPSQSLSLGRLGRALTEALFPPSCLACGRPPKPDSPFCESCALQVRYLEGALCSGCGLPLNPPGGPCRSCAQSPPAFDRARAVAWYEGPLGKAVRNFKYNRRAWQGRGLARLMAERAPREMTRSADLIAPVPLHPLRLITRGFNQSMVLARAACNGGQAQLAASLLKRLRHTRPQVGLDPDQRLANVAGAFGVGRSWGRRLQGARVLVVDDVYTTGATANECARVLKAAGASAVDVLTLVRTGRRAAAAEGSHDHR